MAGITTAISSSSPLPANAAPGVVPYHVEADYVYRPPFYSTPTPATARQGVTSHIFLVPYTKKVVGI